MGSTPSFRTNFSAQEELARASTRADEPRDACAARVDWTNGLERYSAIAERWCCYLLLCADGSYYCGITTNLKVRLRDHVAGRGSAYTRAEKVQALVWYETHQGRNSAAAREKQIKAWSRAKKNELASGRLSAGPAGHAVWVPLG